MPSPPDHCRPHHYQQKPVKVAPALDLEKQPVKSRQIDDAYEFPLFLTVEVQTILIQKRNQGNEMDFYINRIWHTKVVIIEVAIETN